ncbi:MAG: hypothetical protein KJ069_25950 [Anaerolineae bacterium]|nr:hypothetical protein [Anaerolineae bacterium]
MLHPLNPPDRQCEDDLFALIELQRKTLTYALNHNQFGFDTFRIFMGDDFFDWFEDGRNNGQRDQKKAFNNFHQNLIALTKFDAAKKQTILDDFDHDQNFYFHLDDHDFMFAFSPVISAAHENAKACLNSFYEFLSWGFPAILMPSGRVFYRQDIVQSYIDRNPILVKVCPCCDNSWPEPDRAHKTPYTLEHFFHKDEHPTICLHPYNLIPMCRVCNGRRGKKEMLSPKDDIDLSIDQIFHPLERPVRKHADLEFRSRRLEPEIMRFVNLPTRIDDWQIAINAYEDVYEIPSRWQANWREIESAASNAISYAIQGVGVPVSRIRFGQELDRIVETFMRDYGRYQYPAGRWLIWAKTNYFDALYSAHVESRGLNNTTST